MLCCSFMPKWRWRWNSRRGGTRNRRLRSRWCSWYRWYRWSRAHWWDINIDVYPRNIGILIFIPPVAKGVKTDISTCAAGHVSCLLLNVWGWLTLGDLKKCHYIDLFYQVRVGKEFVWYFYASGSTRCLRQHLMERSDRGVEAVTLLAMWCIFSHCKYVI